MAFHFPEKILFLVRGKFQVFRGRGFLPRRLMTSFDHGTRLPRCLLILSNNCVLAITTCACFFFSFNRHFFFVSKISFDQQNVKEDGRMRLQFRIIEIIAKCVFPILQRYYVKQGTAERVESGGTILNFVR